MGAGGHGLGWGGAQAEAGEGHRPGRGSSAKARSGRRPTVEEGAAAAAGRDGGRGADKGGGAGRHEELGRGRPVGGGGGHRKLVGGGGGRLRRWAQRWAAVAAGAARARGRRVESRELTERARGIKSPRGGFAVC